MKKIVLMIALVATSGIAMAQKGSWYIGGAAGYASSTFKAPNGTKDVNSNWAFAPEVGTFLKDDIQLGLALGISGSSVVNNDTDTQSSTSLSPTAYVRKFFKITDNFSTFGGFYLNYTTATTTDLTVTPNVDTKQSGIGVRLGIGVAYALSPRFTAVGQYGLLGYQSLNNSVGGTDTGTDSSFSFGVNTVGYNSLPVQGTASGPVFNIGLYYTFKTM